MTQALTPFNCIACAYSYFLNKDQGIPEKCPQCGSAIKEMKVPLADYEKLRKDTGSTLAQKVVEMIGLQQPTAEEVAALRERMQQEITKALDKSEARHPAPTAPFIKHDSGKLQWSLLPEEALEGVVRVLMHGAKKYTVNGVPGDHNWKKGAAWSRYYNAARRHMKDFWVGNEPDPDSGESHLDHALCCLIFLRYFAGCERYKKFDDRYTPVEPGA